MVSRRAVLAGGAGVAAGLTATGCGGTSGPRWVEPGSGGSAAGSETDITIAPVANATGVSPLEQIVVIADQVKLQSVTVTDGAKEVAGAFDETKRTWRSTDQLAYGKTYTVAVTALDTKGNEVNKKSTFTTLKPSNTASVTFQANAMVALKAGGLYGVGQPVIVHFSKAVKDHLAAEQAMVVTTEPAVTGRWRWLNNQNAHWRPAVYWTPGTKISVKVNIVGVDLGGGVFGAANAATSFTIGPSRIAVADANTHYMQVFINGSMVRNIPVSMGMGGTKTLPGGTTIDYWTKSGPHVVLMKEPTVRMNSSSYGVSNSADPNYYDEIVKLCCRISFSGEYVHLADWNIPQQGRANTSHGCINVGPAHAQWFYDTFGVGDVVEVKNTPKVLAIDNGVGDWTIPWDKW